MAGSLWDRFKMGEAGDSEEQGAGEAESGRRRREWERLGAADADRPGPGEEGKWYKSKKFTRKKTGSKEEKAGAGKVLPS